jgi:hypothetical protein
VLGLSHRGSRCPSSINYWESSYSDGNDGESCVELATTPGTIHIRDSKNMETGPRLAFTPDTWADFLPYATER